jgi:ElaB/YqjD/DUF883 family membrane-anchored ribosome-binding protein
MSEQLQETEAVTMGKLVQDLKVVMHDAEGLLKATAGEVGEKAREARVRLAASLESARTGLVGIEEKAIAQAKAAATATDKVIREHPYQSIGVAFGVGLLIGVLVTRK